MALSEEARYQVRRGELLLREREARRATLTFAAERVAALLKAEFGATRVLMFGTLVKPWLHEESDIDMAVEGIAPSRQSEAWDRAQEEANAPIDLVFLEEAPVSLRGRISSDGKVL